MGEGPHVYVLGEVEEPTGPVKIGMTTGRGARTGRPNLGAGNWRQLEVLHRWYRPAEEVRWTEWLVHQHLRPWHRRGEWFDVRPLVRAGDWETFLASAYDGTLAGAAPWRLGTDDHHLVAMHRLTVGEPRQFDARCSCGRSIVGDEGQALLTVQKRFAAEHLGSR